MAYESMLFEKEGNIATLTFNRPDARNAVNNDVRAEFAAAIEEIEADDDIRVMILTGKGKAFASGADAVVLGSALAKAKESPGRGYHWGMATPHRNLPRGTRIYVGTTGTLEEILIGPARMDDGSQNFVGALRTCMGYVGARNLREMHLAELIIAPAIKTEGKIFQKAQQVGMGK